MVAPDLRDAAGTRLWPGTPVACADDVSRTPFGRVSGLATRTVEVQVFAAGTVAHHRPIALCAVHPVTTNG